MATKKFSVLIMKPLMRFSRPSDSNNLNDDSKYVKKLKNLQLLLKNAKIHDVKKVENLSITTTNCAVIYRQILYQTLEEVS